MHGAVCASVGFRGCFAYLPCNGTRSHLGNLLQHTLITSADTTPVPCIPMYTDICNLTGMELLSNSWWIIYSQEFSFICCSQTSHTPFDNTQSNTLGTLRQHFQINWYNRHNRVLSQLSVANNHFFMFCFSFCTYETLLLHPGNRLNPRKRRGMFLAQISSYCTWHWLD